MPVTNDPASISTVDNQYVSTAFSSPINGSGHPSRLKLGCRRSSEYHHYPTVPRFSRQENFGSLVECFTLRQDSEEGEKLSAVLRTALAQVLLVDVQNLQGIFRPPQDSEEGVKISAAV
ncbi:hypothetical protein MPH_13814 [Macrophomina phaseolina MS6]|uniref:Uncharacterized protein n=1 Tax=Macrophomina phaseolina (strain MS6) TaxID=1126212 RepID=K2QHD7_MACPH|nr:hypothetical protein MPH_13814 [Macrophomina phaseolina MS6]